MSLQTLSGIPPVIESGDTVLFTENFGADYPVGTWTAVLWLQKGYGTPASFTATTSGSDFLFTLSAASTASLAPGYYDFAFYLTSGSQRATGKTGTVGVLPNLAVAQTATSAQAMLAALETAITTLSASVNSSVSFNGQSYTKASLGDLLRQRMNLQAEVFREQQQLKAMRGETRDGFVEVSFASQQAVNPLITGIPQ